MRIAFVLVPEAASGPDLTRYLVVCAGCIAALLALAWAFRRYVASHLARRGKERTRIADRLPVNQDTERVRIIPELIKQVAPSDIEHRSCRNKRAEAHCFLVAPIENRRAKRPALTQERHIAREGAILRKRSVQSNRRIHDAQTIWPDQA